MLLLLLLCSGLAGQVGARRAGAGAEGSRRGGGSGGPAETGLGAPWLPPRGGEGRGVAVGEGLGRPPWLWEALNSASKHPRLGGPPDSSFGVLNLSVTRSPHPPSRSSLVGLWEGTSVGFGHYLSFTPPITAPNSSPAPPVWAGGGTRMCVTDGDVCEVLEGCWVNVGAFVSRLGVTESLCVWLCRCGAGCA